MMMRLHLRFVPLRHMSGRSGKVVRFGYSLGLTVRHEFDRFRLNFERGFGAKFRQLTAFPCRSGPGVYARARIFPQHSAARCFCRHFTSFSWIAWSHNRFPFLRICCMHGFAQCRRANDDGPAAILISPIFRGRRCHEESFAFLLAQTEFGVHFIFRLKWSSPVKSMPLCPFLSCGIRTPLSSRRYRRSSGWRDQDGCRCTGASCGSVFKQGSRTFNRVRKSKVLWRTGDDICHLASRRSCWLEGTVPALGSVSADRLVSAGGDFGKQ